jgi:hypothetical protein
MDGNLTYLEGLALGTSASLPDYISGVAAGTGLTGGGSSGDVTLSIPSDGVTEDMLSIIGGPTAGYILSNDGTNLTWIQANPGDITGVIAGTGLTGGGLSGDVTLSLDIPDNYIGESKLNIVGGPTAGYILSNDGTNLTWIQANPGDITGVIAGTGLTGGGLSGDVTLYVDDSYFNGFALTTDLSNYLPLAGGTISGSVSFDTNAVLTGTVTSGPVTYQNEIRLSGPAYPGPSGIIMVSTTTFAPLINVVGKLIHGAGVTYIDQRDTVTGDRGYVSFDTNGFYLQNINVTDTSAVQLRSLQGYLELGARTDNTSITSSMIVKLSTDLLTSGRNINFPDASGTLALTSDTGEILYVSINGNDSTGQLGDITKPYKTISAAMVDATAGQTIFVFPGTYYDYNINISGKNNVSVILLSGVIIQPNYNGGDVAIFKDISGSVTGFKILGNGKLINNGNAGSDSTCVQLGNGSTIDIVEALEISTISVYVNSSIKLIRNAKITGEITSYYGGSLTFEKCSIENTPISFAFNYLTGDFSFRECTFRRNTIGPGAGDVGNESCFTILPSQSWGSVRRFYFQDCDFINTLSTSTYSTPDYGLAGIKVVAGYYSSGSSLSVINCRFYMAGATASPLYVTDQDPGIFWGTGTENTNLKYYLDGNICNTTPITIVDTTGITTLVNNEISGSPGFYQANGFRII